MNMYTVTLSFRIMMMIIILIRSAIPLSTGAAEVDEGLASSARITSQTLAGSSAVTFSHGP